MSIIAIVFVAAVVLVGAAWFFREDPGRRAQRLVASGAVLGQTIPQAEKTLRTHLRPQQGNPGEFGANYPNGIGVIFVHVTVEDGVITQASTQVD